MKLKKYLHKIYRYMKDHIRSIPRPAVYALPTLLFIFITIWIARPAFAQGFLGQMLEIFKEKIGFSYSSDSTKFIFSKDTPNYRSFAGSVDPIGGHRIMLERDGTSIELSFLSAKNAGDQSSNPSPDTITSVSDVQQMTLDTAESILLRLSSASAQGRTPVAPSQSATPDERAIIVNAESVLNSLSPPQTPSASPTLTSEAKDFSLLLRIKSFKIDQLSLAVDRKLEDISKDVSTVVSQAQLVDEPTERKVTFHNINKGLDLDYRLNERGIRQQIILQNKDQIYTIYQFNLESTGLIYKDVGHGVWYFNTLSGNNIMRIPKAWATDADGKHTNDVEVSIEVVKNIGKVLTVTVSSDWLSSPERIFPIIVETAIEVVPEIRKNQTIPSSTPSPSIKNADMPSI